MKVGDDVLVVTPWRLVRGTLISLSSTTVFVQTDEYATPAMVEWDDVQLVTLAWRGE